MEGRYAELMVQHPATGPDMVSWVWGAYHVGQLVVMWIVGPMADMFRTTKNVCLLQQRFRARGWGRGCRVERRCGGLG